MKRVEKHLFVGRKDLEYLCWLSKNMYNYANYQLRQGFIKEGLLLSHFDLIKQLAKDNQIDYRALPSQTSQEIIKLLNKNWKSFFKANKAYWKNPSKFLGKPKIPRYKKKEGLNVVTFTNQQCKLKDGYIRFPKMVDLEPLKTKVNNICQVRIIPQQSCIVIEVVYNKEIEEHDLDESLYMSIDLGINNLAACVTNSGESLLVNGRVLKSMDQYYNKKKALYQSYVGDKGTSNRINRLTFRRNNKVNDYMHKTSRFIINYCLENKIKNIIVGYNQDWKQNCNIGRVNNQKFVQIPHKKLIQQIQYKAEEVGIVVQLVTEEYTSKCDALSLEGIEKHEVYVGKRKFRGLFQSSVGRLINADINGALNILRKVIGDEFILTNRGCGQQPVRINPLTNVFLTNNQLGLSSV